MKSYKIPQPLCNGVSWNFSIMYYVVSKCSQPGSWESPYVGIYVHMVYILSNRVRVSDDQCNHKDCHWQMCGWVDVVRIRTPPCLAHQTIFSSFPTIINQRPGILHANKIPGAIARLLDCYRTVTSHRRETELKNFIIFLDLARTRGLSSSLPLGKCVATCITPTMNMSPVDMLLFNPGW